MVISALLWLIPEPFPYDHITVVRYFPFPSSSLSLPSFHRLFFTSSVCRKLLLMKYGLSGLPSLRSKSSTGGDRGRGKRARNRHKQTERGGGGWDKTEQKGKKVGLKRQQSKWWCWAFFTGVAMLFSPLCKAHHLFTGVFEHSGVARWLHLFHKCWSPRNVV